MSERINHEYSCAIRDLDLLHEGRARFDSDRKRSYQYYPDTYGAIFV